MSVRRLGAVVTWLVLAGSLAACGEEEPAHHDAAPANGIADLAPAAALRQAFRATRGLDVVTYAGSGSFAYPTGVKPVTGRFTFTSSGACELVGRSEEMGHTTLRMVGDHEYLHADATALSAGFGVDEGHAKEIQAAWFAGPRKAADARACSLDQVVQLSLDTRKCNDLGVGQVDGTPTAVLSCPGPTTPVTFYVSTVGDPLVVRVTGTDADGAYDLRLVGSGTGRTVRAPRGPSVVDLGKLDVEPADASASAEPTD
jgi:hypothetical protein